MRLSIDGVHAVMPVGIRAIALKSPDVNAKKLGGDFPRYPFQRMRRASDSLRGFLLDLAMIGRFRIRKDGGEIMTSHMQYVNPWSRKDDGKSSLNRLAFSATAHCLTGCAIGEVMGMVIGTALGWGNVATIGLAVILAFIFGYALTMIPLLRAGLGLSTAPSFGSCLRYRVDHDYGNC